MPDSLISPQQKKKKVLIIKMGYSETLDKEIGTVSSLGDVLRSTVILHHFKEDHVTWLVDEKSAPLLDQNPYIDRVLVYDSFSVLQLMREHYDVVVNLEKVPGICSLADSINAWRRYGFRFDQERGEAEAHDGCEWVFRLCKDEDLKKRHRQSWQEILLNVVGAQWEGQEYILGYQPQTQIKYDIGLNWAVGKKWPNKAWPKSHWEELVKKIEGQYTYCWQEGLKGLHDYIDWVNSCRLLVTNDSLGTHIALALKRHVLVLYGPTNGNETFFYGRGELLYPEVDYDCLPCLSPQCHQDKVCMEFISPDHVKEKIDAILNREAKEA